jgi:hypothetical protein
LLSKDEARRIAANIAKLPEAFATTLVHALGDPNSPVCRQDEVKLFLGYGVHPAADSASARKCESVFAVAVDNGKLNIAVERSGIYWLPVHNEFVKTDMVRFDVFSGPPVMMPIFQPGRQMFKGEHKSAHAR